MTTDLPQTATQRETYCVGRPLATNVLAVLIAARSMLALAHERCGHLRKAFLLPTDRPMKERWVSAEAALRQSGNVKMFAR